MNKKVFGMLMVLLMLLVMHINGNKDVKLAMASENKNYLDSDKCTELDYEDVQECVDGIKEEQSEVIDEDAIVEVDFDIKKYDEKSSYKEYILSNQLIMDYFEKKSIEDIITSESRIKVPYTTETGENAVAIFDGEDNMELQAEMLINDTEHIFVSTKRVNEIISNNIAGDVKDVIYTYSNRYYSTLVFVITSNKEYVIPFNSKCIKNIDNGKVYEVEQFFKNMQKAFDEDILKKTPTLNQGIGYKEDNEIPYFFIGVTGIWIVSLGGLIFVKRRGLNEI